MQYLPKIAIIDSGIGGISVLNKLITKYKCGSFVYIADNLYMPYGNKTKEQILNRVLDLASIARNNYHCNTIILACNTASIVVKNDSELNDVIKLDFSLDGLYLTTELTAQLLNDKNVIPISNLAEDIESNIFNIDKLNDIVLRVINKYNLSSINRIILGCTHYELVGDIFRSYLEDTEVIDNSTSILDRVEVGQSNMLKVKIILTKNERKYKNKLKKLIRTN